MRGQTHYTITARKSRITELIKTFHEHLNKHQTIPRQAALNHIRKTIGVTPKTAEEYFDDVLLDGRFGYNHDQVWLKSGVKKEAEPDPANDAHVNTS